MRAFSRALAIGIVGVAGCYQVDPPAVVTPPPVVVPEVLTPEILTFMAVQPTVLRGRTVEIQYKVKDAEFVKIDMGTINILPASIASEGRAFTPPLSADATITITATNKEKTATRSMSVVVTDVAPPTHATIELFAPDPVSINEGEIVNLNWRTTEAATGKIMADNATLFTIAVGDLAQGTFAVTPVANVIYTLSVIGTDAQEVSLTRLVSVAPIGTTNLTARELYDRSVLPVLTQACKSCHEGDGAFEGIALDGPNFMGPNAGTSYGALTTDTRMLSSPENSLLLIKGLHSGPAFTPDQVTKVSAWLLKEIEERGTVVGPPPPPNTPRTFQEGLTRFNACMTKDNWDATIGQNNDTNYGRQGTAEGQCNACHDVGAGGFIAKSNSDQLYEAMKGPIGGPAPTAYLLKLITGTVDPVSGVYSGLVESYRVRDKQDDPGHPNYQLTQERMQAITDFVTLTMARYSDITDACAPPPP